MHHLSETKNLTLYLEIFSNTMRASYTDLFLTSNFKNAVYSICNKAHI